MKTPSSPTPQNLRETNSTVPQRFTIQADNGACLSFTGHIFSEGSFFDEENRAITRMKLFITKDKRLVYYVVSGAGQDKTRRVYELYTEGDICHIYNGQQHLNLPVEMLFTATASFCGIVPAQAENLRASLEESLRAVSS